MKSNRIFQVGEKIGCFFLLFPLMFSCSSNGGNKNYAHKRIDFISIYPVK